MLNRRAAHQAAHPIEDRVAPYRSLLRAAEANPDEFFSIAGEKLAALLHELENAPRLKKSRPA